MLRPSPRRRGGDLLVAFLVCADVTRSPAAAGGP